MRLRAFAAQFLPDLGDTSVAERLRASLGAMLGLFVTGFVSRYALGTTANLPLLIAPMGASAVLLFAVPSSPLAQPWSILGGNVVSALIGVTAARFVPDPFAAAALGGAAAIAAMMMLRCLHPPSGAVALTAVLGGPAIQGAGYGFALFPVGLNSALLLAVALLFNNATGRRYPHRPAPKAAGNPASPDAAVGRVLRRHGEVVDVGRHDLALLLEEVETEIGSVSRCAQLMRPEPDRLSEAATLDEAIDRMTAARRPSLPVVDRADRLIGLVSQADLIRHLRPTSAGRRTARLFRRSLRFDLAPPAVSGLAIRPAATARADTPLPDLLETMLAGEVDYCPVLDSEDRLLGAITQVDMLHWLAWRRGFEARPSDSDQPSSVIQRL